MKKKQVGTGLPLARFERVRTRDVDQTREVVGREFCPHQLTPLDSARRLDTRFHSVRAGNIGLNYLDYGASVRILPGQLDTFFLVQMPLAGNAEIVCGRERVVTSTSLASVPAPFEDLSMCWGTHNPQLLVWLDRDGVQQHLAAMLGRPVDKPVRFSLGMDMTDAAVRSWRGVVDLLCHELDHGGRIPTEPLAMRELERLILSQLLLAQPNNYSQALAAPPSTTAPRVIRLAVDLIEDHASEPLTVDDVAERLGIGVRTLQAGFRRHLDTTPMNHLREVRLRRSRTALMDADPATTTVTEIAARCGFVHVGRFSTQYRHRFGESPSTTLRR